MNRNIFLFLLFFSFISPGVFGQPDYSSMDIKKPEKYENSKLGAEKTDETKFKQPRHFIQNTVTHYNYYFNANIKLNEVIARARAQHKDDYNKLLSFYDYSLDITSRDRKELDSIIYKSTAGILNHDLRNDWIDNLYMLMGEAYYYRNQLDSAYITFQFVNHAFAPKDKDGSDQPIGSNANNEEGGNSLIVATKEKKNILKKVFSLPPSRNESLIWQVKTYIASNQYPEAAGLIEVLKQDPQFPQRLQTDLQEAQAWLFYSQNMYDSAAGHLILALTGQPDRQEKSRWEYLIAQLYERSKKPGMAQEYYKKVFQRTYDPVMEVYARLNYIRQNKGSDDKMIQQNIDALMSMARKARFENYRDIIYYAAAQIELERKNKPGAIALLLRSIKNTVPENNQKSKAFLALGDLYYSDKNYRPAKNYYDSVDAADRSAVEDPAAFLDKRKTLDKIISEEDIINRQDSLQRIAAMPETERNAYIKKLARRLRKEQGLAEEESNGDNLLLNNNGTSGVFGNSSSSTEWYFDNSSIKAKGFGDFKSKWGNRPNVDFWQVASKSAQAGFSAQAGPGSDQDNTGNNSSTTEISFESLLKNLPLAPPAIKKSNDSIQSSLFSIGESLQEGLSDYQTAIATYNSLLKRFPDTHLREQALFNLYYCYKKSGDEENAKRILQMMIEQYPNSKLTNIAAYPEAYKKAQQAPKAEATKKYEDIYNAFIEGRFEEALANKKAADSAYGEKYWTPQLLYIEAVYLAKNRNDSLAKIDFAGIIRKYPKTPMADKAKIFLDVLSRRKQIEEYLTNLQVTRAKDDSVIVSKAVPLRYNNEYKPIIDSLKALQRKSDSTAMAKAKANPATQKRNDSAQIAQKLSAFKSAFAFAPEKAQAVAILMNKVDPVYVNETRNAFNRYNQETFYSKTYDIVIAPINDTIKLVLINGFQSADDAIQYIDKAKKIAPREIVPWLPVGKYSFLIISNDNLEILKTNKDIAAYKKFLETSYPGKF
ncbi:MAG: tetratricopeptide repeat protein [Bacteroidetes bacterium]|nr:tetratricopeptide repeat protein [Bacteroidota bacterium]